MLERAAKEDGVTEQPLYIDADKGVICCHWCGDLYKGSTELKHVNQHVKKAASHISARKRHDRTTGENPSDIRNFCSARNS